MKKIVLSLCLFLSACGIEYDYITDHGMMVQVGVINAPAPDEVYFFTEVTMSIWKINGYTRWTMCMDGNNQDVKAHFEDKDYIEVNGYKYAGYADHKSWSDLVDIYISSGTKEKIWRTFIHELSHVYVGECGGIWSNDGSHALFREVGIE